MAEDIRSYLKAQSQHFSRNSSDLPLSAVTAAVLEEIEEGPCVHGNDDFCFAGIREEETGVLVGEFACF